MGCDIHLYVERKTDGVWNAAKGVNPDIARYRRYAESAREREELANASHYEAFANDIESGVKLAQAEDDYDRENYAPMVLAGWAYDGRNYDLFSILADVRNGWGFAGSYTGEGFKPIADPKGVPDDMSDEVRKAFEYWDADGHSHSWFTVKELLDYDWEQTTQTLKDGFYPIHAPKEMLQESLRGITYKESAGSFYSQTIPMLKEMAGSDLESVRIVFWFDN